MTKREKDLWQGIDPSAGARRPPAIIAVGLLRRSLHNGALRPANCWLRTGRNARTRKRGSQGRKFSHEKFTRNVIEACSANSCDATKEFWQGLDYWPKQWSAARMFGHTAKGFHVHPPSVPEGSAAADWLRRLFVDEPEQYSLRRYDDEQWDVMFFLQGRVEMILCDIGQACRVA